MVYRGGVVLDSVLAKRVRSVRPENPGLAVVHESDWCNFRFPKRVWDKVISIYFDLYPEFLLRALTVRSPHRS